MTYLLSLSVALSIGAIRPTELNESDSTEFGFYHGEFLTYAMSDQDPMAQLITHRLAESIFQSNSTSILQERLRFLKETSERNPELLIRFSILDEKLKSSFTKRVSNSKTKKLYYAAGGALLGALIGIPVGKWMASHSTLGTRVLWITVPAGALMGAGAGYLLSGLLEQKSIQPFNSGSKDLEFIGSKLDR